MTTRYSEQRTPQGGLLRPCISCGAPADDWMAAPMTGEGVYRRPAPGCTGALNPEPSVFAKRSEATDGPELRQ